MPIRRQSDEIRMYLTRLNTGHDHGLKFREQLRQCNPEGANAHSTALHATYGADHSRCQRKRPYGLQLRFYDEAGKQYIDPLLGIPIDETRWFRSEQRRDEVCALYEQDSLCSLSGYRVALNLLYRSKII